MPNLFSFLMTCGLWLLPDFIGFGLFTNRCGFSWIKLGHNNLKVFAIALGTHGLYSWFALQNQYDVKHLCRELHNDLVFLYILVYLLCCWEMNSGPHTHTRAALFHWALFLSWNSIVEVEIKFLNLHLISKPPAPHKFLCADAGLPFLGHCNLDFLESFFFPMTGRNYYSLWQETKSWQEPYNNYPIGFIF